MSLPLFGGSPMVQTASTEALRFLVGLLRRVLHASSADTYRTASTRAMVSRPANSRSFSDKTNSSLFLEKFLNAIVSRTKVNNDELESRCFHSSAFIQVVMSTLSGDGA